METFTILIFLVTVFIFACFGMYLLAELENELISYPKWRSRGMKIKDSVIDVLSLLALLSPIFGLMFLINRYL